MSELTKIADLQRLCERAYFILDENWNDYVENGLGPSSLLSDLKKVKDGKEYRDLSKLTDVVIKSNKVLEHQNEALVTMVKVFKACIETGVYPIKDSPCYEKINELIGGEK